jgi:spermidine synthase
MDWVFLESAPVPESESVMDLLRYGDELVIRVDGRELMGNRAHGSEEALAELAFDAVERRAKGSGPYRALVGGLGAGFTLAAALRRIGEEGVIEIAELVPEVVRWNRESLGQKAGFPLEDRRVVLYLGDVAKRICAASGELDVILLDVDNGPESLSTKGNDWLYSMRGLEALRRALRPHGVAAVWSAGPARGFLRRFVRAGFDVETHEINARGKKGGRPHVVFLGTRNPQGPAWNRE